MKSKFLFLMSGFFFVFLLAGMNAVVVYGDWQDSSQDIQITLGDSVDFSADFFTMSPPMTINIKLYNNAGALVHAFEDNRAVSGNSFAQTYTITSAIYQATGSFELILSSSDFFPSSDSHTLLLTVNPISPPANNAPVITTTPITQVNESSAYSYDVDATDADGDVLTYSLTQAPSWLSINTNTGLISGTAPSVTADTNFNVTVSVSDGKGGVATQTYVLTVRNIMPANNPPVAQNQSITTNLNTAVSITLTATDADGNTLTFSIVNNPANGVLSGFNSTTGQVTYTPNSGFTGADSFTFKANDGQADSNTATVSITVNPLPPPGNNPPVITSAPVISVNESQSYSYQVTATDADGDTLIYSLTQAPSWLSINAQTGLITGTAPVVSTNTQFNITVSVSDGKGGIATQTYVLTVVNVVPPANNAPVITSTPLTSVNEGQAYSYDANATDADGDVLTYSLTQAPSWLSINSATGLITGTAPSVSVNTNYNIAITVSDGQATTTQNYVLTVVDIARPRTGGGGARTLPVSESEEKKYLGQFAPRTTEQEEIPTAKEKANALRLLLIMFWLLVLLLLLILVVMLVRKVKRK